MNEKRFQGELGKEYELIKLPCPQIVQLQNTVGGTIKDQFLNKPIKTIKVIEIGCGYGLTTLAILDSDDRTQVIAVDNEVIMTNRSEEVLSELIENGRAEVVNADALEFLKRQTSNSFDVFASGLTLHNFTKKYRAMVIYEAYRILKPGGIFVNMDKYALDDDLKHQRALRERLQQFKDAYLKIGRPDLVEKWQTHYIEDNRPEVLMKETDSIKLMKKVGFKNVKIILREQIEATLFAKK